MSTFTRSGLFTPFTPVFNATGQPAISLPLFEGEDGLPLGGAARRAPRRRGRAAGARGAAGRGARRGPTGGRRSRWPEQAAVPELDGEAGRRRIRLVVIIALAVISAVVTAIAAGGNGSTPPAGSSRSRAALLRAGGHEPSIEAAVDAQLAGDSAARERARRRDRGRSRCSGSATCSASSARSSRSVRCRRSSAGECASGQLRLVYCSMQTATRQATVSRSSRWRRLPAQQRMWNFMRPSTERREQQDLVSDGKLPPGHARCQIRGI